MKTMMLSEYLQKLIMTQTNVDSEYLGVDSELNSEVLGFLALKSDSEASFQVGRADNDDISLDEYELAMAG